MNGSPLASVPVVSTVSLSVLSGLVALVVAGCNPGPNPPRQCEGAERAQLNCESEFKYDGRKIEGGFSAIGLGSAQGKTEETALRAIDKETEQYVSQSRRLCDEYNACVIDKETYATRSENLRRRMAKVPELYDEVKGAGDDDARRKALSKAYTALVPDDHRRELELDFAVEADKSGSMRPIAQGESLGTGTRVAFVVRPSRRAYVYLFQKSPDGKVNVLFPDTRIDTKNPLAAGSMLRLPPGDKAFKLNDKDIGTERVYIVASLDPLTSLDSAVERSNAGSGTGGALVQVTDAQPTSSKKGCTRALELEDGPPRSKECTRSRGLQYDDGPSNAKAGAAPPSLRARTEAADSVIVQVFAFEHSR